MSQSSPKFRPYLTLQQMEHIVSLCESDIRSNHTNAMLGVSIIESLKLMILKAQHSITKPSFIPLAAKLGIPTNEFKEPDPEEQRYMNGQMTPEEAAAYESKLMERINHGTS